MKSLLEDIADTLGMQDSGVQFNACAQFMLFDVARALGTPCLQNRLDCTGPQHPIEILHWVTIINFLVYMNSAIACSMEQ